MNILSHLKCGWLPVALALSGCGVRQADAPANETESSKGESSYVNDVLSSMSEKDRKNFTGGASINNDGVASYNLPTFADEQALLETHDIAAFAKAGRRRYPDIATVAFKPSPEMREDAETMAMYRDEFYAGLYYAKLIKAADGSSLFDLMTKCGRLQDPASGADLGFAGMGDHKGTWVNLQFFPVFRQAGTSETTELQILFERDGNVVKARSQFFSSHVLNGPGVLIDHGLECFR